MTSVLNDKLAIAIAPTAIAMAAARGLPVSTAGVILGVDPGVIPDVIPDGYEDPHTPTPVEALGALYENLLDTQPSTEGTLQPSNRARKGQGAFFTGDTLTRSTVERSLMALTGDRPIIVCDPAMGGGAFLLAALRELVRRDPQTPPAVHANRSLYGVDIDPLAVRIARLAIWLEVGDPDLPADAFAKQLRSGDALVGRRPGTSDPTAFCEDGFAWNEVWPDVFAAGGFDAVLGNPPWGIRKPDSRAYFSRFAAEYRDLGKQEALARRAQLFREHQGLEQAWQEHLEQHKAYSRWCRDEGYEHQGRGDANCYKLFLELGLKLLRPGGQLGMIIPSGLYTDLGCAPLRRLMLDSSQWRWLFAFENRKRIFPIDRRFKFAAIVVEKGGQTQAVRTAFMRHDATDWVEAEDHAIAYERELVGHFSPESQAFLEVRHPRDLEVLNRLYADDGHFSAADPWAIRFRREFDLTMDSARFPPIGTWEAEGFSRDAYDRWRHPDGRCAVALTEGRMVGQYDFSQKGWVEGRGRRAKWRKIPSDAKRLEPQYLMSHPEMTANDPDHTRDKIAIMAIGSATNERSMFAASLIDSPCGNSAPTLRTTPELQPALLAVLNSFCYDFALRIRLGGININRFVLAETPLPPAGLLAALPELVFATAALSWTHIRYARAWMALGDGPWREHEWTSCWASKPADRARLRAALDAVVAVAYGIRSEDYEWILRGCEHSREDLAQREFRSSLDPKGFWRVDRSLAPAQRLPARCRAAYRELLTCIDEAGTTVAGCQLFLSRAIHAPRSALARNQPVATSREVTESWDLCRRHRDELGS